MPVLGDETTEETKRGRAPCADPRHPWAAIKGGVNCGNRATRKRAMNVLDRGIGPYRHGFALVFNRNTGETWERRSGSWFKRAGTGAG